jgi:drug/metabolite transporter (DMT)-like permease
MTAVYTWLGVALIVIFSTAGDCLLAYAMKQVGDLHALRRTHGVRAIINRIATNPWLFAGVACMTVAFFSLLFALSWGDVSLVGPASASLTFVGNAIAGKLFLKERVDRRRWTAALLVAGGVFFLAR